MLHNAFKEAVGIGTSLEKKRVFLMSGSTFSPPETEGL